MLLDKKWGLVLLSFCSLFSKLIGESQYRSHQSIMSPCLTVKRPVQVSSYQSACLTFLLRQRQLLFCKHLKRCGIIMDAWMDDVQWGRTREEEAEDFSRQAYTFLLPAPSLPIPNRLSLEIEPSIKASEQAERGKQSAEGVARDWLCCVVCMWVWGRVLSSYRFSCISETLVMDCCVKR